MTKIFKVTPILLLVLLVAFPSTVYSDDLGYFCAGHPSQPIINGRGIRGSLMIYQRNFDSWPWNPPQYWIQMNMEDAPMDNFVEGGLTTYQDIFGYWHLYIFMSVMDNGTNPKMIKTEEIPFPTQSYSIELIRNLQNPKLWLMLVWRPGNPGYETWYSYEFANIWSGKYLMSQTEGYHQPSAGQNGLHVGEFNNLQWYNDNGWMSWTDCRIYTTTPQWKVNGVSTGADSWYSYIGKCLDVSNSNNENIIDIRDIATVAKAYGSYPGHPKWNAACDFDDNDKINIIDISMIARNFGKTCSDCCPVS